MEDKAGYAPGLMKSIFGGSGSHYIMYPPLCIPVSFDVITLCLEPYVRFTSSHDRRYDVNVSI